MSSSGGSTFPLSGLKLPEIHSDDTKSSPGAAVSGIQKWFRSFKHKLQLKNKITSSADSLSIILSALNGLQNSNSFEKSQRDLFGDKFSRALNSVVDILPHHVSTAKALQTFRAKSKKNIASALFISKFPGNILFSDDVSISEQSHATNLCLHDAIHISKALRKFVTYAINKETPVKVLEHSLQSLVYALYLFTSSFSKWQIEDRFRMTKTLEDSFCEGYSALIATKASIMFQNADPALLHVAEHQLAKVKDVMTEMLGASANHRFEELCAAVESSMPIYAQMRAYEESLKRGPTPVVATTSSNNTTASSTLATPERKARDITSTSPDKKTSTIAPASVVQPPLQFPSLQGSNSGDTSPIVLDQSDVLAMKYLDKLAKMTGLDPEQLAYEMTLDKFYRLPAERPSLDTTTTAASAVTESSTAADWSTTNVALLLRKQILESMADKMVNSLKVSNVQDITQLAVGLVVPVRFAPNTYKYNTSKQEVDSIAPSIEANTSAGVTAPTEPPICSARITAIHYESLPHKLEAEIHELDVDSAPRVTDCPALVETIVHGENNEEFALKEHTPEDVHLHNLAVQHAISELHHPHNTSHGNLLHQSLSRPKSMTGSNRNSFRIHNEITVDVEYIFENNMKEEKVSVERIKLASHAVDPSLFLNALSDLCYQIAAFTPNRHDLINNIFTHVDFVLLKQMIEMGTINPVSDLLPVLTYLQRSLLELQAPSRAAGTEEWIRDLTNSFYATPPAAVTVSGQEFKQQDDETRVSKSFQDILSLLPKFFERASDCIEEIQRDMANFYISALVPVMQRHGALFIAKSFQQRLQQGQLTLDATASLLISQVSSALALKATAADLTEAGVCGVEGFVLHDLCETSVNGGTDEAVNVARAANAHRNVLCRAVVARSFITLLQLPIRLDSRQAAASRVLPETLLYDASRLAAIRDYVDKISLESSIVIISRQLLSKYQVSFKDSEEIELQHRLDVLLTEHDVNFASVSVEVVKYVKYAIYRHREITGSYKFSHTTASTASSTTTSPRPNVSTETEVTSPRGLMSPISATVSANYDVRELQDRVEKTVKEVIAPGNAVLTLFTKRVYKILLRVMLGQPYLEKLQSYSLHSKGQERNLTQCIDSVVKLFNHSYAIHGDLYGAILSSYATHASSVVNNNV